MKKPLVIIGTDHHGFELKQALLSAMSDWGYEVVDAGAYAERTSDYPPLAFSVAREVAKRPGKIVGVLLCGSGIGMSIAANKVKGARAALVTNKKMATQAVEHDHANILVLPALYCSPRQATLWLKTFLTSRPDQDSAHKRRVKQIHTFERLHLT